VPIRGVTFDFDGTLADTLPVCYTAFRRVFLRYTGREYSDIEIHGMFGPCEKGVIQRLLPDWQEPFAMFLAEYEVAHAVCPKPFDGIVDLLDWLRAEGVRTAVVTGKGAESAAISLDLLGLSDHFEIVEAGTPSGVAKAEGIRRTLDTWSIPPTEVVHIGDAQGDIRAALAVGALPIGAVWASTAVRENLEDEGPAAIFGEVAAFRDWLASRI
jgi:pyrophosphatase PpaX